MADKREMEARLRARFRTPDQIPAPDLWPEIERREPGWPPQRRLGGPPIRRVLIGVAAVIIAAGGLVLVSKAFLSPRPGVATDLPGGTGVSYLSSAGDGRFDLVTVTGQHPGLSVRVVARGLGAGSHPTWSADGSKVAYLVQVAVAPHRTAIVVQNADGSGRRQLTECCDDADPVLSPDGSAVAFVRATGTTSSIATVSAAGGGIRQICPATRCGAGIADLAWSPDGRTLAFSHAGLISSESQASLRGGIELVGADGSAFRHLTACGHPHCTIDVAPAWSPDGTRIAYNHGAGLGHGQHFRVVDVALHVSRTLTGCVVPHCVAGTRPVWSPNGRSIAFPALYVAPTGDPAIRVVDVATAEVTDVRTCLGKTCLHPSSVTFAPDGTMVLFVDAVRGAHGWVGRALYIVPAGGGTPKRLAVASNVCCPSWQPG